MKSTFSTSWKNSVQPRKQRKYRANADYHIKGSFMHAKLAKDLRQKHNAKSARVRTGDKVKVMRGQFKGNTGTVSRVDVNRERVYVSSVELTKKEGGKVPYPVHPSKVLITSTTDDKRRFKQTSKDTTKAAKPAAPAKEPAPAAAQKTTGAKE